MRIIDESKAQKTFNQMAASYVYIGKGSGRGSIVNNAVVLRLSVAITIPGFFVAPIIREQTPAQVSSETVRGISFCCLMQL